VRSQNPAFKLYLDLKKLLVQGINPIVILFCRSTSDRHRLAEKRIMQQSLEILVRGLEQRIAEISWQVQAWMCQEWQNPLASSASVSHLVRHPTGLETCW